MSQLRESKCPLPPSLCSPQALNQLDHAHPPWWGLPRWPGGKESACQCKRHWFDLWVGKIPWRRKRQPLQYSLLEKSYEQRSLAGYSPWGHKEFDTTEHTCSYAPRKSRKEPFLALYFVQQSPCFKIRESRGLILDMHFKTQMTHGSLKTNK